MRDNVNRYTVTYYDSESGIPNHHKYAGHNTKSFLSCEDVVLEDLKELNIWSVSSDELEQFLKHCEDCVVHKLWAIEHLLAWLSSCPKHFSINHNL